MSQPTKSPLAWAFCRLIGGAGVYRKKVQALGKAMLSEEEVETLPPNLPPK